MSRPDGRCWLRIATVGAALAVAAVACSDEDGRRRSDSDPAPAASTLMQRLAPGDPCPVTAPTPVADLPTVLAAEADSSWFGKDELWVSLPVDQARTAVRSDGRYRIKFGTVTLRDGQVTSDYGTPEIRIRRLDGRGTAGHGFGGYATTGEYDEPFHFWPTGIDLSHSGCWLVSSSLRDTTVRFVLRVS